MVGWLNTININERAMVCDYMNDYYTPDEELYKSYITLAMSTIAKTASFRLRTNIPSIFGCNWRWRVSREQLTEDMNKAV